MTGNGREIPRGTSPAKTEEGAEKVKSLVTKNTVAGGRSAWVRGMLALGLMAGLLLAWAAQGASAQDASNPPNAPEQVFALTVTDDLLRFDGDTPREVVRKNITGLMNGESLVGIDFRPSAQAPNAAQQGVLYGVGDMGYIYTIRPNMAIAERGPRITADGQPVVLRGESFGIDFNPTVDRLRIVSDANQNLRVNVDTGALADFDATVPGTQPDLDLQYAAGDRNAGQDPAVGGVAYRNSQPSAFGTTNTQLLDIDARTDDMSAQNPPNNGTLNTVGGIVFETRSLIGFDIVTRGTSPGGDRGFAVLKGEGGGNSGLYGVNLNTGEARKVGLIGARGMAQVEGFAIPIGQQ